MGACTGIPASRQIPVINNAVASVAKRAPETESPPDFIVFCRPLRLMTAVPHPAYRDGLKHIRLKKMYASMFRLPDGGGTACTYTSRNPDSLAGLLGRCRGANG